MKKKKDQGAWTRSPVLSVCLAPAATADNDDNNNKIKKNEYIWTIPSAQKHMVINTKSYLKFVLWDVEPVVERLREFRSDLFSYQNREKQKRWQEI